MIRPIIVYELMEVTAMLQVGMHEKLMQQCTGHRSIDTLYERISELLLLDVSNVVLNSGPSDNTTDPFLKCNSMPPSACVSTNSCMPSSRSKVDSSGCTFNDCTISLNARKTMLAQLA